MVQSWFHSQDVQTDGELACLGLGALCSPSFAYEMKCFKITPY